MKLRRLSQAHVVGAENGAPRFAGPRHNQAHRLHDMKFCWSAPDLAIESIDHDVGGDRPSDKGGLTDFVRLVAGVCFSDSATRATKIHSLGALGG
jgi:hypothetical protein